MVDRVYLLNVADLRDLCIELRNYTLQVYDDKVVVTRHDTDDLNIIKYSFPVVADLYVLGVLFRNREVGQLVCMDIFTATQVCRGMYLGEDGEVTDDFMLDWENFWPPLEALLIRERKATWRTEE